MPPTSIRTDADYIKLGPSVSAEAAGLVWSPGPSGVGVGMSSGEDAAAVVGVKVGLGVRLASGPVASSEAPKMPQPLSVMDARINNRATL